MADTLPFVGREAERETLHELITDSPNVGLCPVVAQSGYGKSALLENVQQEYDSAEVAQFFYRIKEPRSGEQFFQRVLESWQETFPKSRLEQVRDTIVPNLLSQIGSVLKRGGPDPVTKGAGAVVGTAGDTLSENSPEIQDIAVNLVNLAEAALERSEADYMVLVFDQFDQNGLTKYVRDDLGRVFRTVGQLLPDSILCCVGTKFRFYQQTADYVSEIELSEFSQADVQEYIAETGFNTELAQTVYTETSGHPYYVTRVLQIARNQNSLEAGLDDLPNLRQERYRRLEERFLGILQPQERDVLEATAVLQELRPQIVAALVDESESDVQSVLDSLYETAVLKRRGFYDGTPVYQRHELQRQHLQESISESERADQHRAATAFYLERMIETLPMKTPEFFTSEGASDSRRFIAAGTLFEYHLHHLPATQSLDNHLDQIITKVSSAEEKVARQVITEYYRVANDTITESDVLDIEAEYDTQEVVDAARTQRSSSPDLPSAKQLFNQLQEDESLTLAQAKFTSIIYDTLVTGLFLNETRQENIELVQERRNYLNNVDPSPDMEPMVKLARATCIWWLDTVAETDTATSFWSHLSDEYDLTQTDWEQIRDVGTEMFKLFDVDFEEISKQFHGNGKDAEDKQRQGEALQSQISEHGVYGGLTEAAGGPVVMMAKLARSLKTGEDIEPHIDRWTDLERHFSETGHPALAALCQDVTECILRPLSDSSAPAIAILRITRQFEINDTNAIEDATIAQVVTLAQAVQQTIKTNT